MKVNKLHIKMSRVSLINLGKLLSVYVKGSAHVGIGPVPKRLNVKCLIAGNTRIIDGSRISPPNLKGYIIL